MKTWSPNPSLLRNCSVSYTKPSLHSQMELTETAPIASLFADAQPRTWHPFKAQWMNSMTVHTEGIWFWKCAKFKLDFSNGNIDKTPFLMDGHDIHSVFAALYTVVCLWSHTAPLLILGYRRQVDSLPLKGRGVRYPPGDEGDGGRWGYCSRV